MTEEERKKERKKERNGSDLILARTAK